MQSGDTWSIFGSAERIKIDEPLWQLLSNPGATDEISASNVHFALVSPTAAAAGRKVKAAFNGNAISVSF